MSTSGMVPAPGNGEPVDRAAFELARDISADMLRDVGRSYDEIEGRFDTEIHRQRYPFILLGELAMYIADVQLPEDATEPDRARAVIESLRRIAVTPRLLEAVTNAPFSSELSSKLSAELPSTLERDEEEAADAEALRAAIRKAGYLEHGMIPNGRSIQLHYRVDSNVKPRRFGRNNLVASSSVVLKLAPAKDVVFKIARYERRNHNYLDSDDEDEESYEEYLNYLGQRELKIGEMFSLVVASYDEGKLPQKLARIIGHNVRIGRVNAGSPLRLIHGFGKEAKEVDSEADDDVWSSTLTLPSKLQQAYLGESTDYPLFHESYT